MKTDNNATRVVILGAGPAGLTAAYELSNLGVGCVVLEQDAVVGGLARTVEYKGFRFDIGGHRFYTKVSLVQQIWHDVLGDELLRRKRLSRIYYKSRFLQYPLEPFDAIQGLGLIESFRCGLSFVRSRLFPTLPECDFETWVSNRFGRRLFEMFFESYTEKVWGNMSDAIWKAADEDLIALAKREMVQLGLVRGEDVVDGAVVRMTKAYPVYDRGYQDGLAAVREFLAKVPNLQLVGRNGMHRYNNQDHSMLTAILAARNVAGARFDLWNLSVDKDYLEAGPEVSNEELAAMEQNQPLVPKAL